MKWLFELRFSLCNLNTPVHTIFIKVSLMRSCGQHASRIVWHRQGDSVVRLDDMSRVWRRKIRRRNP
uniref:Uncharacterized protein n=1 Tax=Kalanchoe fedtschenkoi TaxID=63787 RepID=A0A7N0U9H2_KALFE